MATSSISEAKVATIFLQFEEFLRKAGKLNMFDTLVYNYRLKTPLSEEALRNLSSNLNEFLTQVFKILKSEEPEEFYQIPKELHNQSLPPQIQINCLSGSVTHSEFDDFGKIEVPARRPSGKSGRRLQAIQQSNISVTNLSDPEVADNGIFDSGDVNFSQNNNTSERALPLFCCNKCSHAFKSNVRFGSHDCVQRKKKTEKELLIQDPATLQKHRRFLCGICLQEFRSYSGILVHLQKCESGPYACELCTSLFSTMKSLNLHKRIQHKNDKSFICNECGHSFRFKSSLLKHKLKTHENANKTYKCESCDKVFHKAIVLANHKLKYHQIQIEKKFACTLCENSYMTRSSLKAHEEIRHRQTKKFKCELCDKEFLRKDKLQIHSSSHTGIKPFVCEICGKNFSRKSKLTEHRMRHFGEKKYLCTAPGCVKSYASNTDLKIHLKKVHSEEAAATSIPAKKRKPRLPNQTKPKVLPVPEGCPENAQTAISPETFSDQPEPPPSLLMLSPNESMPVVPVDENVNMSGTVPVPLGSTFDYASQTNYGNLASTDPATDYTNSQIVSAYPATTGTLDYTVPLNTQVYDPAAAAYDTSLNQPNMAVECYQHQQQYSNMASENGMYHHNYQMQYNYNSANMNVNMSMVSESHTIPVGSSSVQVVQHQQHYGFTGNANMLQSQTYQQYYGDQGQGQGQYVHQHSTGQNQTVVSIPNQYPDYNHGQAQYPESYYNQVQY